MAYLEGKNLVASYGVVPILHECSVAVEKGELAVIVGPNGAGKSTVMRVLLGMLEATAGSVTLDGKDISMLSTQDRISQGLAFVPQTKNVFPSMTVEENLQMGGFIRKDDISSTIEEVYELFPILYEKRKQLAEQLSGGQRQQVAFGRAMMTKPSVMLLDEPTAGVSPIVMDEIFSNILDVRNAGMAVLMVEQNAQQALNIADKGFVLVSGRNEHTGTGKELINDPEVRKKFLGG
ncbi:MAG: ABC transporter ATP-binding protein [Thiotrichales bacterium]|jgi:branched-chain amino acid transport system ATP-binding protein|nr:ABC transporter ATP-binding protein [Thiotrichales bacterium]MBT5984918.1 ABC transporter ATP-binding protein [Thiotrichales bacterium]MBT7150292.1 ABC transporter ATP-binding protein [Thiotrichales bacterium]MBT7438889.1 ABC transporter ATP-binding protein [Thiotrichales bacterium]